MQKKKTQFTFINIILIVVTLLIFLFLMEIILRIIYPIYSNYNTEMWRYSRDMKIPSSNKLMSYEHTPNKSGLYYGTMITTNADGFRDYYYDVKKPLSTYRILMLGDSVTLGWGTNSSDIFSKVIERKLNSMISGKKIEVINTGIGCYNTQMEVELLKQKGLKYNPDMIILNYYINDPEPTKKTNTILYFLQKNLYTYMFFWDKFSNLFLKLKNETYISYYSRLYEDSYNGKTIMLQSINELAKIVHEKDIKLLIVVYPDFHNFPNYRFEYVTHLIRNASISNRIYFLDLLPYFKDIDPESIWVSKEDAHPNSFGHSIAADAITKYLIEKNLV